MTSMEEDGTPVLEDVPVGNPDELAKNPVALKGEYNLFNFWLDVANFIPGN